MKIELCDCVFEIKNQFAYVEKLCKNYITDKNADVIISYTKEDIQLERENSLPEVYSSDEPYESLAIYRKICSYLALKDVFLMHSAILEYDNKAIAFLAHSGVGKSTHLTNWKKEFGDKIDVVNGDKPLIWKKDGVFYACGTPWAGKEGWNRNVIVPLYALCFLSRDTIDSCKQISVNEVGFRLFDQIYVPPTEQQAECVLQNLDEMINTIKKFELKVTKEQSSAKVAFDTIIGE